MKKYITAIIFIVVGLMLIVASCDNKQAYCNNCNNPVTVNEAVLTDGLPHCDKCGHNQVYYK